MNCRVCGKKIGSAYVLCGECSDHLVNGTEQTRLGYFVHHPDQMVEELLHDAPWCKNLEECLTAANRDEALDDEKCKQCCMDWLLEKVDGA